MKSSLRYQGSVKLKQTHHHVQKLLAFGLIEPSLGLWASPLVLMKKQDSTDHRFCLDYRRLNAVKFDDAHLLPHIETIFDAVAGVKYMSMLDTRQGYWSVALTPQAQARTAFCYPGGLFQFMGMPFGPKNALGEFMRLTHQFLS